MDGLVSEHPELENDSLLDWQPVEVIAQHMIHGIKSEYATEQSSSCILNRLQSTDITWLQPHQQRVALVQPARDESLKQSSQNVRRQRTSDNTQLPQLKNSSFQRRWRCVSLNSSNSIFKQKVTSSLGQFICFSTVYTKQRIDNAFDGG